MNLMLLLINIPYYSIRSSKMPEEKATAAEGEKNAPEAKARRARAKKPSAETASGKAAEPQGIPKEYVIGAVVVFAILAGLAYMMSQGQPATPGQTVSTTLPQAKEGQVAEEDDIVTIEYTGTYENGTVFDTSDKDKAQAAGVYTPLRTYEPMSFTLGQGGLIKGFENAIVGMKVGQEKEFTLSPEEAYGYPKKELIQVIDRLQKSPVVQNVSREKFIQDIGAEPYVGFNFTLENRTEYDLTWPMRVLAVNNDTITFRYFPTHNATLDTVFGLADVYGTEDNIVIKINPIEGQRVITLAGPAKVLEVNDNNVTIDFNHELTGKTLKFKVKLINDVKQE
jgi:FKBP-type peptidyl-prolyl cis-trans isomerase 2